MPDIIKLKMKVWVNEKTKNGKDLPHEWYGTVTNIVNDKASVRDTNKKSSYFGQIFNRSLDCLEPKED